MTGLRDRKKLKVRLALATAALRLIDERGLDGTTVEEIAEAADVSPRTFFRYFRTKEDVFLVDPERKLELIREELRKRRPDEPILVAIRRTLATLGRDYASDVELIRAQYRVGLKEPTLVARGYVYQVRWEDALAEAVAVDLGVDQLTDVRPRVLAHVTVGVARTAVATWIAGEFKDDAVDVMLSTFDLVEPSLRVLLAQPGDPAVA
jgi:AcrR family transcriptional regulator